MEGGRWKKASNFTAFPLPPATCPFPPTCPESLNCRWDVRPLGPTPTQSGMPLRGHENCATARDVRPLGPTPTQSGMPLRGYENCAAARDLRPTHPPLRFAETPPGWLTWVLAHPRNEPGTLSEKSEDRSYKSCACPVLLSGLRPE